MQKYFKGCVIKCTFNGQYVGKLSFELFTSSAKIEFTRDKAFSLSFFNRSLFNIVVNQLNDMGASFVLEKI